MEKNSKAACVGFQGEACRSEVAFLIMSIHDEIPNNQKGLRERVRKILDGLHYKAPECIGESLMELFHFLRNYIDLDADKNPQWVDNIYKLWNDKNTEFKNRS